MTKEELLEKISELLDRYEPKLTVKLEDNNFKVSSKGWKKITVDGKKYLENKTKDIWELADGQCKGEQLFTFLAAIRETKKVGKRMPTDDEFSEIVKTAEDMPNIVYPGYRNPGGAFDNLGPLEFSWSSSVSGGSAWIRFLSIGSSTVLRNTLSQSYGFSVRCVKD